MSIFDSLIAEFSGPNASADSIGAMSPVARAPLALNATAGAMEAFGGGMGAVSHVMYGIEANRAAQFEAGQMRQEAGQAQAGAQRNAYEVDRQTQLVTSRALAVAAASGGGASDPTVVNLIARDAGQGAYEKAVALYQGAEKARYLQTSAAAKEYQGKEELFNSTEVGLGQGVGSVASILRSQARGASLYSRYAGDGPPKISDSLGS